ncbi:MAG: 23S rRNA (adenine(2503)-C(2))-methyltransferase RlmN [Turicibacter sp.]|nr:23S rRNA (adenine(2503)-C(2))-methyltransferase RlmN [Turicibacter sp.]MBQ1785470.1 23S rRNA (adenine(2503)-C(2))-methyltransferase RlmN [Turicibacter sp.]MEE0881499.1 23S rRNA (adenine(2503)-C(2))-methyltransferase RlmN [Turicibacter sp.]MEE1237820.1 23S rRNA (adenine(2503)-C(2))-methyltransferase RlmN [Turicibacter sp.]
MEFKSIFSLDIKDWQDWLVEHKQPKFRAAQIFDWLYKKRVSSIEEMSNLPKDLKASLSENFDFTTLSERKKQVASDGTTKFLFELADGNLIETVLMRHNYGCSVCVTTQVGCRIGCKFCASTLSGLKRNLEAGEIVAQVLRVQQHLDEIGERVSHIVVMGIGEPFENYDNLTQFIHIINNDKGLNIGARHITVSTSGIVPKIYDFANHHPQVSFAISLHAPNDELRTQLMPINRAYPLVKLLEAAKFYVEKTNRRITFEYGLIKNVNDTVECANQLADVLRGINCHVNLIPVNYVPERGFDRTPIEHIEQFEKTLKKRGINATVRRELGSDIDAACGQLRAKEGAL